MENKNKRSGRRKTNRGSEVNESSSAVGSVKNTTEEVTVRTASGSWRKGNGRRLECPLTVSPVAVLSSMSAKVKVPSPSPPSSSNVSQPVKSRSASKTKIVLQVEAGDEQAGSCTARRDPASATRTFSFSCNT